MLGRRKNYEVITVDSLEVGDVVAQYRDGLQLDTDGATRKTWFTVIEAYHLVNGDMSLRFTYELKTKYTTRKKTCDEICLPETLVKRKRDVEQ